MESKPQQGANGPPPKPWERGGTSSGSTPFKPPSPGRTSDVVESSGTAKPGEIVSTSDRNVSLNRNTLGRPVPTRPWDQNYGSSYGGYGSGPNYNSGYGSGTYGSYGGLGGSYGGGMYGNSMYRGGGYGGLYGGSGMHGGGMYNGGFGGPMGGYGMGMGGPYGEQDPNNPYGAPPSPPGFWVSFLRVMQGVVTFFGRIAFLIDQNTQAFHMFMSALLQAPVTHGPSFSRSIFSKRLVGELKCEPAWLVRYRSVACKIWVLSPLFGLETFFMLFERSGLLYGELARFVLRLLGIRTKPRKVHSSGPGVLPVPHNAQGGQNYIEGPKGAPTGSWDSVWGNDSKGM